MKQILNCHNIQCAQFSLRVSILAGIVGILLFLLAACDHSDDSKISKLFQVDQSETSADELSPIDSIVEIPELQPLPQFELPNLPAPVIITALPDQAGTTERVSISDDEQQSLANSISSSVSANGRFIAFDSIAFNLVANDSNNTWDIFVRDRLMESTTRISVGVAGDNTDDASIEPVISDDGSIVVFESLATNLVEQDTNNVRDIFYANIQSHVITRISVTNYGTQSNNESKLADMSGNGRYVVFESLASNLDVSADTNEVADIFLRDMIEGTTERISLSSLNAQANGASSSPSVSDDGRFIVFESDATNLVDGDTNGVTDIFLRDRLNGTTHRLSVNAGLEQANGPSGSPKISGNSAAIIFHSTASNLVANDNNDGGDIFLLDLNNNLLQRISVNSNGDEANRSVFRSSAISFSGRYVLFYSSADNMTTNDDNNAWDVFLRDRELNTTSLISKSSDGVLGNNSSFEPAISAGGHYAVFGSNASNLVNDDNNGVWDAFLHVLKHVNQAPIANAGDDQQIYLGESVELDGRASADPDDDSSLLQYFWSIQVKPDNSSAMLPQSGDAQFTFIPDVAGDYIISLVVNDGEANSVADDILISVVQNLPPEARISASAVSGNAPFTVQLSADDSIDPEGGLLVYEWNFGDSVSEQNTSTDSNTMHTYRRPGVYTIMLTVTDDVGQTNHASVDITVTAANVPPTVMANADVTSGTAPLNINFMATANDANGDLLSFAWDFGDGNQSDQQNPMHVYTQTGSYNVSVTVSDGEFTASDTLRIEVTEASQFELKILHLKLVLRDKRDVKDKLRLVAELKNNNVQLNNDDLIRLRINSSIIVELPVADFKTRHTKENKYYYYGEHLHVMLDMATGLVSIYLRDRLLRDFNPDDAITVSISLGSASASEQVMLQLIVDRPCHQDHHNREEYDGENHDGEKQSDNDDDDYASHRVKLNNEHEYKDQQRSCRKRIYVYQHGDWVENDDHDHDDRRDHEEDVSNEKTNDDKDHR